MVHIQRIPDAHRHLVEEAKARGCLARGMVAGRAGAAEGCRSLARQHQVGGQHSGARGAQRGLQRGRIHERVGVDETMAFRGTAAMSSRT